MEKIGLKHIQAAFIAFERTYGASRMEAFTKGDATGFIAYWAEQLAGLPFYRLRWAMRNLPPAPPSLPELRKLMAEAPSEVDIDAVREGRVLDGPQPISADEARARIAQLRDKLTGRQAGGRG